MTTLKVRLRKCCSEMSKTKLVSLSEINIMYRVSELEVKGEKRKYNHKFRR